MDKQEKIRRLKTIEGHVRGIERMVEQDVYCIDLIRQIQAVQSALRKLSSLILDDHLHTCLIAAVQGDEVHERERVLSEIAEVYAAAQQQ
jgi:DNA-binding FrmR family transcriptional regulator